MRFGQTQLENYWLVRHRSVGIVELCSTQQAAWLLKATLVKQSCEANGPIPLPGCGRGTWMAHPADFRIVKVTTAYGRREKEARDARYKEMDDAAKASAAKRRDESPS